MNDVAETRVFPIVHLRTEISSGFQIDEFDLANLGAAARHRSNCRCSASIRDVSQLRKATRMPSCGWSLPEWRPCIMEIVL